MKSRLIVGGLCFITGYLALDTNLVAFSMGMMIVGFYLTLSALFIHLFRD